MTLEQRITTFWFSAHKLPWWQRMLLTVLLWPLSLLFGLVSKLRRLLFAVNIKTSEKLSVPVLVVGNISVGGNGKTPVVLALIDICRELGLTPGVISRGYGGKAEHYPLLVTSNTNTAQAGDEPAMIAQNTGCLVAVGADRKASGELLIANGCNFIICDDGLQHYQLHRDGELVVIDGDRLFGNEQLLPLGPLREGTWRLAEVDYCIINGETQAFSQAFSEYSPLNMQLKPQNIVNVQTGKLVEINEFLKQHKQVHAIAGIGSPQRFFNTLTQLGFHITSQAFADHYQYSAADFTNIGDEQILLMTEKDAVKCQSFAGKNWYYLTVEAGFSETDKSQLRHYLKRIINEHNHHGI